MDRIRRNERLAAMTRILVESPNKIFTLGTFCEMFGAAMEGMKNMTILDTQVTIRSAMSEKNRTEIEQMAKEIHA